MARAWLMSAFRTAEELEATFDDQLFRRNFRNRRRGDSHRTSER